MRGCERRVAPASVAKRMEGGGVVAVVSRRAGRRWRVRWRGEVIEKARPGRWPPVRSGRECAARHDGRGKVGRWQAAALLGAAALLPAGAGRKARCNTHSSIRCTVLSSPLSAASTAPDGASAAADPAPADIVCLSPDLLASVRVHHHTTYYYFLHEMDGCK